MNYKSTRNSNVSVTSAEAIAEGISPDGGLYLPEIIPSFTEAELDRLADEDYIGRAKTVLSIFLTDYTEDEIDTCVRNAYTGTFDNDEPAPLARLNDKEYVLELWHGPTCAFKDLALQLLPYLMTTAVKKTGGKKTVILVATSGDTGKAALEGFKDVDGTDIIVFYPSDGVSDMQKLQMQTQRGKNVMVCAIKGNFDDAQTGVKRIFTDKEMCDRLDSAGYAFSSANSINWGRLVPQIVYYVSLYCDLKKSGADIKDGFNVVVPTGNFGNILAAYYAKRMGIPIAKLICASNANNVLTEFINTGVYNKNRKFHTTFSPSMDILVSSNLERLLYLLCGCSDKVNSELQKELSTVGEYTVSPDVEKAIRSDFAADWCSDDETLEAIKKYFDEYGYLCDTHTAVAAGVYEKYVNKTGDKRTTVIVSTASPYKFTPAVLKALGDDTAETDGFILAEKLEKLTGTFAPESLTALKGAEVRFGNVCDREDMKDVICGYLGI